MEADRVRGILPLHELTELQELTELARHSPNSLAPSSPAACSPAPYSPAWARGVSSLGGHDFLVIDLCGKLRLAQTVRGREPVIVVVEVNTAEGLQLAGFIADRVSDVVTARDRDYRRGKLRTGGRPRIVLDPNAILALEPAVDESLLTPIP